MAVFLHDCVCWFGFGCLVCDLLVVGADLIVLLCLRRILLWVGPWWLAC